MTDGTYRCHYSCYLDLDMNCSGNGNDVNVLLENGIDYRGFLSILKPGVMSHGCLVAPIGGYAYSSPASSRAIILLKGPFLTMMLMTSYSTSAAAMVVSSALVSYAGYGTYVSLAYVVHTEISLAKQGKAGLTATSTISAAIRFSSSKPLRMVLSSLVDHPPVSGVPVAGANAGSRVSMSIDRYTGFSVPTRSRMRLIMPAVPMESISRASTISKPQ